MKKFTEAALVLAILLFTGSAILGQAAPTFQIGDVFAGIGQGKIQWYRPTPTDGGVVYTLVTTLTIPFTNTFDTGMAFDSAGNLYATDFSVGAITKFNTHGVPSLFAGDFGAVLPESNGFDNIGNLFVGDANSFATEGGRRAHIWKLDSLGNFLTSFTVLVDNRGADWIDLAADQKTIFYTSEGQTIKRFDTSTNTQLPDFATSLPGSRAFALRILPNGNVLVADSGEVLQLDPSGTIIRTYFPCECAGLFSLNLDPDGLHFWVGDALTGVIYQIRITGDGTVVDKTINTGVVPMSGTTKELAGVAVFGEATSSSNTVNVQFTPSTTPETQIATVGNPTDPAAQSLALTLASVTNAINVSVEFFYEPTDLSTGTHGVGIADGICEAGANETQDFDCRSDPDFVYQVLANGDKVVPHIIPSHNFMGVWIRVIATRVSDGKPAVAGVDYAKSVDWYYAWNANPVLQPGGFQNPGAPGVVNPKYATGWNEQNPQMYDRPGENVDIAFVKNITTYLKNCSVTTCVGTADPGLGGHTITLNDVVGSAPPNPPAGTALGTVEMVVPVPGISPFPYVKTLPMLVAFKLETESTETSIANAVTPPHSVHVATLEGPNNVPIATPAHFPTTVTYNSFAKVYYIFLSPAPYKTDGTVYTLQINSDLFQQPVSLPFVVKASQF